MTSLPSIIEQLILSGTRDDDESGREAWIRHHRLEPLIYGVELNSMSFRLEFIDECRKAYINMTGRAVLFCSESKRLVEVLAASGLSSIAWRGVIYGDELYGDPGLRYCTDVDLMVAPEHRGKALECLLRDEYQLRNRLIPRWYLHRHHLHWPLINHAGTVPVDLHWAVDHPYKNATMPVDLPSMSHMEGKLQAAVYHAEKECRLFHLHDVSASVARLLQQGPLLPWLDLGLMMARATHEEQATAHRHMDERGHGALWSRAMAIIESFEHPTEVAADRTSISLKRPAFSFAEKFAVRFGCRAEALTDWVDYLSARSMAPRWYQRVLDHGIRWAKVIRLAVDTVVCGGWMAIQKLSHRKKRMGMA